MTHDIADVRILITAGDCMGRNFVRAEKETAPTLVLQLLFELCDVIYPFRRLAGYIENIPLVSHHARPAPDTLVSHPVERVRLQPGGEDIIDHLLRRSVEDRPQKIVGKLFPKRPDLLASVTVLPWLTVFVIAIRLEIVLEIRALR